MIMCQICAELKEMMKQPDRHRFEAAMQEEVNVIFKYKIWEQVPR